MFRLILVFKVQIWHKVLFHTTKVIYRILKWHDHFLIWAAHWGKVPWSIWPRRLWSVSKFADRLEQILQSRLFRICWFLMQTGKSAGWSKYSPFANAVRYFFYWGGSFILFCWKSNGKMTMCNISSIYSWHLAIISAFPFC